MKIEKIRELLGKKHSHLSDLEVLGIERNLRRFASMIIDSYNEMDYEERKRWYKEHKINIKSN